MTYFLRLRQRGIDPVPIDRAGAGRHLFLHHGGIRVRGIAMPGRDPLRHQGGIGVQPEPDEGHAALRRQPGQGIPRPGVVMHRIGDDGMTGQKGLSGPLPQLLIDLGANGAGVGRWSKRGFGILTQQHFAQFIAAQMHRTGHRAQ